MRHTVGIGLVLSGLAVGLLASQFAGSGPLSSTERGDGSATAVDDRANAGPEGTGASAEAAPVGDRGPESPAETGAETPPLTPAAVPDADPKPVDAGPMVAPVKRVQPKPPPKAAEPTAKATGKTSGKDPGAKPVVKDVSKAPAARPR